jgi:hypothetical protein
MSTDQLKEATSIGYKAVGSGIKSYIYGWWLQFSRALILFAWFFIAGATLALLSPIHTYVALIGGFLAFVLVPVAYGYWQLSRDE